jgi:hypothetical protein
VHEGIDLGHQPGTQVVQDHIAHAIIAEARDMVGTALSHTNVTRALVHHAPGAISPKCEDDIVVCSSAAPSVQAGESPLTSQWIGGSG